MLFRQPTPCLQLTILQRQRASRRTRSQNVASVGVWAIRKLHARSSHLPTRHQQCSTARPTSFCAHTINGAAARRADRNPQQVLTAAINMTSRSRPLASVFLFGFAAPGSGLQECVRYYYFSLDMCIDSYTSFTSCLYWQLTEMFTLIHQERRIFRSEASYADRKWADVDQKENPGD